MPLFFRLQGFAIAALATMVTAATCESARADNFGAIALSPSTMRHGWSYDFRSRALAEAEALRHCGEPDCAIQTYFWNGCGALAIGDERSWGADWGSNKDAATAKAIAACSRYGKNCTMERWACTTR